MLLGPLEACRLTLDLSCVVCARQARQSGGTFVLRIEDTDTARSTRESEESMVQVRTPIMLHRLMQQPL
jgi:hypothetical protein